MNRFTGMGAFLSRIVEDAPSVRAVAVLDLDGRLLHTHGTGTAFAFYQVDAPLVVDGATLGHVRVSLDKWLVLASAGPMLGLIMAVTLLMLLAALWLTGCLAVATVIEPLTTVGRTFIRGSQGDFRLAPRGAGWGGSRGLARLLAARIETVRHSWLSLHENAMAARAAHFDPAVLSQIDTVVDTAARGFRLPAEDVTRDNGLAARGALQFVLFLLVVAEAVCLPTVAATPDLVAATWLPALLITILPVGLVPLAGRSAIIGGALTIALGQTAAVNAEMGSGMVLARLAVGIGYGLAFRGVGAMALQWRGLRAVSPGRQAVLIGMTVGPLLGGLLAAEMSPPVPFVVAAVVAGSSLLVGRLLPPPAPQAVGVAAAALRVLVPLALLMAAAAAVLYLARPQIAGLLPGWQPTVSGGALVSLLAGIGLLSDRLFRRSQGMMAMLPPLALALLALTVAAAVLGQVAAGLGGLLVIGALLLSLVLSVAARRKAQC